MLQIPWTYIFLFPTLLLSLNVFHIQVYLPSIPSLLLSSVKVDKKEICIDSHIWNDYYDEYEMHYRLEGSADESSPVLVFSNGMNNDLRIWDAAIARLKVHFPNYRFLRYDTRGYRFEGCEKPLNLSIVTNDINVLLDALQIWEAHAVLGASLGGTTAITFAIQYPKRLAKGFVASGIYINASSANSTTVDTRVACAKMCGMPAIAPALVPGWFTSNATNGPVWNEALRMVSNASADGMGVTSPLANQFYDTVNPKDLKHRGLYIAGKEDYKVQGFMKEFVANNTPNEGLHEVGGSHLCMWENPDGWVDAVKDFLSESAENEL